MDQFLDSNIPRVESYEVSTSHKAIGTQANPINENIR